MKIAMHRSQGLLALLLSLPVLLVSAPPPVDQSASSKVAGSGGKTWVGRHKEFEEYLRTAECVRMEELGSTGGSLTRCVLPPGGPVARMSWKPLAPGIYRGFRESYKSDIAAYELDKLLKMDMVPPTVERELKGHKGAATLWVENLVDGSKPATPRSTSEAERWDKQRVTMRMFDNLIGNKDRNLGNILADAAGNLFLIDHSRAFGPDADLPHKLMQVDQAYWARLEGITRPQLAAALGQWLEDSEIAAILARREKMRIEIKSLGRR